MSTSITNGQRVRPGQFFLGIYGLPKRYTWQDLKDLIRTQASHGIWTEMMNGMYFMPNQGGSGCARVQREDEAHKLYEFLTTSPIEGKRLIVSLYDVSERNGASKLLRTNAPRDSRYYPNKSTAGIVTQMAFQPGWEPFAPLAPNQDPRRGSLPPGSPPYGVPIAPPVNPLAQQQQAAMQEVAAAMMRMNLDPSQREHRAQYVRLQQAQQYALSAARPLYAANGSGMPVNTRQGVVRIEKRGIFVSGLNNKTRTKDIQQLFSEVGTVVHCKLNKESSAGKSKGYACIQYTTAAEAHRAIEKFDGIRFQGTPIKVRFDRESTAVNAPSAASNRQNNVSAEPTIVNGSQVAVR